MPGWSSRSLHSNPTSNPTTPAASNQRIPDSELYLSNDYFTPIPPPSLQDPANPFGSTTQAHPNGNSPSRRQGHIRSASDKLPSLFGISRKPSGLGSHFEPRSVPNDSSFDGNIESAAMVSVGQSKGHEDDYETGKCATCDQKVKWPRSRTEYRCGICSMINDLTPKPLEKLLPAPPLDATEASKANSTSRVPNLSVESTQTLIDQCIITFLRSRYQTRNIPDLPLLPRTEITPNFSRPRGFSPTSLDTHPTTSASMTPGNSAHTAETLRSQETAKGSHPLSNDKDLQDRLHQMSVTHGRPDAASRTSTNKALSMHDDSLSPGQSLHPLKPVSAPQPLSSQNSMSHGDIYFNHAPKSLDQVQRHASQSSGQPPIQAANPDYPHKVIFKPLEESIARTFERHEHLNSTFLKQNRRPRGIDVGKSTQHLSPTRRGASAKAPLSEIDPKTLLIGDIAENGLWWTGKYDRTMATTRSNSHREHKQIERASSLVSSRSPHISWADAAKWYTAVINAGREWRATLQACQQDDPQNWPRSLSPEDEFSIDAAMSEARFHVQRVLLRSSDTVLKRPGRPLKNANDFRFLLILLANPMLYPAPRQSSDADIAVNPLERKPSRQDYGNGPSNATSASGGPSESWDQSNAFAIAKRIFGLLSNSPAECQHYLTSWLSRYDEAHFRRLLGLVQTFVSRRLRRQSNRRHTKGKNAVNDLVPNLSGSSTNVSAELHAALGLSGKTSGPKEKSDDLPFYSDDWQIKAGAKVMALLFAANQNFLGERMTSTVATGIATSKSANRSRYYVKQHGQLLSTTEFYNTMVDYCDVIFDFDTWEGFPSKFSFCQYPFFLSVGSKIRIMEHDARRQMEIKAREAFFKSLLRNAAVQQYLLLRVRRECLVEDSLKGISEVVAQGQEEIKKGLKVQFVREEGVDAGGLRKEWFLLLVREIFDPLHAMFIYDQDSNFCYFNPHSFENSDQYFLVGALLGLAIYNSTILDVALPPFVFKKLLLSGGAINTKLSPAIRGRLRYSLDDLAEWRPQLAKGLRDLLDFEGDVQETFCRDFVIEFDRYGEVEQVELCSGGAKKPVTNENRYEFVELYVRYLLDTQVTRQFEPFKRGFFTICGGNALSLFQPEEIELLVRGSEEPLDVPSLKAVALYEGWRAAFPMCQDPALDSPLVCWFWEAFEAASANDQRKLLGFITGSDRIPAVGSTRLIIKVVYGGHDARRLPTARTCFNQILLHRYRSRQEMEGKLWLAVSGSQGFGLV